MLKSMIGLASMSFLVIVADWSGETRGGNIPPRQLVRFRKATCDLKNVIVRQKGSQKRREPEAHVQREELG